MHIGPRHRRRPRSNIAVAVVAADVAAIGGVIIAASLEASGSGSLATPAPSLEPSRDDLKSSMGPPILPGSLLTPPGVEPNNSARGGNVRTAGTSPIATVEVGGSESGSEQPRPHEPLHPQGSATAFGRAADTSPPQDSPRLPATPPASEAMSCATASVVVGPSTRQPHTAALADGTGSRHDVPALEHNRAGQPPTTAHTRSGSPPRREVTGVPAIDLPAIERGPGVERPRPADGPDADRTGESELATSSPEVRSSPYSLPAHHGAALAEDSQHEPSGNFLSFGE